MTDINDRAVPDTGPETADAPAGESWSRPQRPETAPYADGELNEAIELLYFAYRDFIGEPDAILADYGFGRAHHRVVHFVGRDPGMTVSALLDILKITKQSLSRVLGQLVREEFIVQTPGLDDRRQRLLSLTAKGDELEAQLSADQHVRVARAFRAAGPEAIDGFRRVLGGMIDDNGRRRAGAAD